MLAGSAAAGIRDRQPPARFARSLGLVEESDALAEDPFMALALSFDGEALWSLEEGREAQRAVDAIPDWVDDDEYERRWQVVLDATAAHLATDWHRARLGQLVQTRQAQLPFPGFPRASKAIRDGCERFTGDETFRARLAAILLGTLIGRDQLIALRALLAA